jgi:hypothetical protein
MLAKRTFAMALLAMLTMAACGDDDPVAVPNEPAENASLRFVQASSDAPNVDVIVDGVTVLSNVPFKGTADYVAVPSGTRHFTIRATATSALIIDQQVPLTPGRKYTMFITGRLATVASLVREEDPTTPSGGNGRLRLLHAATLLGNVDVYVTEPNADIDALSPTVSNLSFGSTSADLDLPAGAYRVRVTVSGGKIAFIDVNNLTLAAGQIRTLVSVDAPGGGLPAAAIVLADVN